MPWSSWCPLLRHHSTGHCPGSTGQDVDAGWTAQVFVFCIWLMHRLLHLTPISRVFTFCTFFWLLGQHECLLGKNFCKEDILRTGLLSWGATLLSILKSQALLCSVSHWCKCGGNLWPISLHWGEKETHCGECTVWNEVISQSGSPLGLVKGQAERHAAERWGEVGGWQAQFECLPFELILVDLLQQWLKNFLFSLPWSIPWWACACYFLMKPFSQPVVLGVANGGEVRLFFGWYSIFCFFRTPSTTPLLLTACTQCTPSSSLSAQQVYFHSR